MWDLFLNRIFWTLIDHKRRLEFHIQRLVNLRILNSLYRPVKGEKESKKVAKSDVDELPAGKMFVVVSSADTHGEGLQERNNEAVEKLTFVFLLILKKMAEKRGQNGPWAKNEKIQ